MRRPFKDEGKGDADARGDSELTDVTAEGVAETVVVWLLSNNRIPSVAVGPDPGVPA